MYVYVLCYRLLQKYDVDFLKKYKNNSIPRGKWE